MLTQHNYDSGEISPAHTMLIQLLARQAVNEYLTQQSQQTLQQAANDSNRAIPQPDKASYSR